ncbi:cupin domain-containing protein [Streptomyces sp. NPDC057623]|uniref:cupin domain-containing protein n=1 Tax=Streptomyces sp. NPDC057623 TaxID=3346187 RepID=UPI00367D6224
MVALVRRVVTGHRDGKAVVLTDGPAPTEHRFESIPGMLTSILWATDPIPRADVDEAAPKGVLAHPDPGQTRLIVVEFPPVSVMTADGFDPEAAAAETIEHQPGMAERFETDSSGLHLTDSVDYGIVLKGRIWLELEVGDPTPLEAGDVVIQQKTRHAWRNLGTEPARMAFILIGTTPGD